ncbi:MAG: 3-hydroxyacyl-CoA dehydrogenase, partial [Acinetobacter sp.]|nr:3-hydroxyacyl-CoA dehydrogenase [Acinetobacter sp.]
MQQINLEQVKVAVVGAGTMGIGIAQLAAMHGHPTYVFDLDRSKVQSALTALEAQLSKRVQNGKMTQQLLESTFANLIVAEDIQQLADAGLIIEAIVEKKEVKQNLFQQ